MRSMWPMSPPYERCGRDALSSECDTSLCVADRDAAAIRRRDVDAVLRGDGVVAVVFLHSFRVDNCSIRGAGR